MKRSKYDGIPRTWMFGSRRGKTDTWEVGSVSLKRAVLMFRVGCLFPHACSEGRVRDEDERDRDYSDKHYLTSKSGSTVKVYVQVSQKGGYGSEWEYVCTIPVVDDAAEYDRKAIPANVAAIAEDAPREGDEESSALITVNEDELIPADVPRQLMAQATVELKRKQRELELMVAEMHHQVGLMKSELERRMKQIWLIELFLGSKEEVLVLRQGAPAPAGTKVTAHQRVLCMDEELAVWHFLNEPEKTKEFDYRHLEDFDAWLLMDERHLDQIIPQVKGVVALRVRRQARRRDEYDPGSYAGMFAKMAKEEKDRMTYLLVRNGENLYRLWVDVELWPRFFPRVDEWDWLSDEEHHWSRDEDKARDEMMRIAGGLLVLQGLVQRSPLLDPIDKSADVFSAGMEEHFECLRNDEASAAITDGQTVTWDEYRRWMTEQLKTGTRAMYSGRNGYYDKLESRTGIMRLHDWPKAHGIFELRDECRKRHEEEVFSFLYMPSDEATTGGWGWGDLKEREKRVRFIAWATELWPIDHMSWRVMRALLLDRAQREGYMEFFPMFGHWYRMKKAEREHERPFVDLVLRDAGLGEDQRERAERVLRWWKVKNKYHRELKTDEAKAVRMCVRALKRGEDPDDPEKRL